MDRSSDLGISKNEGEEINEAIISSYIEEIASSDPTLGTPKGHQKIWRYVDFTQFISILEKEALHFSRSSSFSDPFEGSLPKRNIETRKADIDLDTVQSKNPNWNREIIEKFIEFNYSVSSEELKEWVLLNCWYINSYESAAMWDLYLKTDVGIAIESTYDDLLQAIENSDALYFGEVDYINYETAEIPKGAIERFYYKRKSFEHENEFRIATWLEPDEELDTSTGIYIPVDVENLINRVRISPAAPEWFKNLVDDVKDSYEIQIEVDRSELDRDPLY